MPSIATTADVGGIFAILTLAHFLADWVFQSHAEAMAKSTDAWVRGKHCSVYSTLLTVGIWGYFRTSWSATILIALVLWISHFIEDTYLPVYVWAKYIRKPLELQESPDPLLGFKAFASTGLGRILLIALDQLVHLVFLLPIAVLLVYPPAIWAVAAASCTGIAGLSHLAYLGKKDLSQ